MKFDIKDTIYGNFVYLGGTYVDQAIEEGRLLEITIPSGTAIMSPVDWKEGMSIKKKKFTYSDDKVVLYGNWVVGMEMETEEEKNKDHKNKVKEKVKKGFIKGQLSLLEIK